MIINNINSSEGLFIRVIIGVIVIKAYKLVYLYLIAVVLSFLFVWATMQRYGSIRDSVF